VLSLWLLQASNKPWLFPSGLDSIILHGLSLLLIHWMCPAHLSLPLLIVLTISDYLYSWYDYWLYLRRNSSFSCIGPKMFLNILLSKVFRLAMPIALVSMSR
jgi:hypothetical protein